MWRFVDPDPSVGRSVVEAALDAGMNLFDTADVYGFDWGGTGFGRSEELFGKLLAADALLRDRIVLATKGGIVPPTPYDSNDLVATAEASLRRLNVDHVDLFMVHRPDMYTHPADVATALTSLRQAGKIREAGVSNHTPSQVAALQAHLDFPLVATQPQFSALHLDPLEDGTLDQCMERGMVPLAWSPLAGGRLATGDNAPSALMDVLDRIAERDGVDRGAVAIAFVLAHPSRPVALVGSQNPDRLRAATDAFSVQLTRNDVYDIIEASRGEPLP